MLNKKMHLKLRIVKTIASIKAYLNLFKTYSQTAEIVLSTLKRFLCFI